MTPTCTVARVVVTVTTALTLVLSLTTAFLTGSAAPAAAVERLAVQVSGVYADSSDPSARPSRTGIVVGTVATDHLGFVDTDDSVTTTEGESFKFTVVCATESGAGCGDGTVLRWTFGDGTPTITTTIGQPNPYDATPDGSGGTVGSALTVYHPYPRPGSHTVRVTVDDKSTPAYGSGAIRALVGPRFADVDGAYLAHSADGSLVSSKSVNPLSQSVWAVAALDLMGPCRPYYSANSAPQVAGERAEDTGRGLFCLEPGRDLVASNGSGLTLDPTNPAPRTGHTDDGWVGSTGTYTDAANCLAYAANCGLPVNVFASHGTPKGSPLATCDGACLNVLTNRGVLTSPTDPQLWYDPTNCADNTAAVYSSDGTRVVRLTRGVEAGCMTRGDFLRALTAAVDARTPDTDISGSLALDTTSCGPGSPNPDPAGRDLIRRAAALLSADGVTISPCDPDAALTKAEAYRMLGAVVRPTTPTGDLVLADLDDRSLGFGAREPYPYRDPIYRLLAGGAPLVGSAVCPTKSRSVAAAVCFNPYEALTRADAAQLLAYFLLGETSDVAALQVSLTADAAQVNVGDTLNLRLHVAVPAWLRPFAANWEFTLDGNAPKRSATFACQTPNSRTLTDPEMTVLCPVTINAAPPSGLLGFQVHLNDTTYPAVQVTVNNTAPTVHTISLPSLAEDSTGGIATATFSDPEDNDIASMQVSDAASGPWSDLLETSMVTARVTGVDNATGEGTVNVVPRPNANGSYRFHVRVCDVSAACSVAKQVSGSIDAVNDAPVAYPISDVVRSDNVVTASGDCTTAQDGPLGTNTLRLRGDDPADDGRSGYTATISSYQVTAPADPFGALYVCGSAGSWTRVSAAETVSTSHPVALFNPTVGSYGPGTYTYTVVDAGYPTGGAVSAPQTIGVSNTQPAIAPTAVLDVDVSDGAAFTTDFTFSGARSTDDGNAEGIVSYAFDYGDGSRTSAQTNPSVTHRYTTAGDYTVTLAVTDAEGLTDTATVTVTVADNLIGNPTLESGTEQWDPSEAAVSVTPTSTDPHGGKSAARVTADATAASCAVSTIPPAVRNSTVAGAVYDATVWVRPSAASAGGAFTVTLSETDGEGASLGSLTTNATLGPVGGWQQVPLRYTTASDGATLTLRLGLTEAVEGTCFDFDDVSLTRTIPAP